MARLTPTGLGPFPAPDLCGCPCTTCECQHLAVEAAELTEGAGY